MPNTPGQIGEGATGYFFLNTPEKSDSKIIRSILASLGKIYAMQDEKISIALPPLAAVAPLMFSSLPVPSKKQPRV